jgi:LPS O-antigen subunit length determinant protein (WzzB/FepE family)
MAGWPRASVLAAAQYLADVVSRSPDDVKAQAAYQGLLEVLEPRRAIRQQRELSESGDQG